MTIDLSNEQFRVLTRALYLSTIVTGEVSELDPDLGVDNEIYNALLNYIVARADDFKTEGDIVLDEKKKMNKVSHELEDECGEILESYEEIVFWDELIHRMASRDMHDEYGHDALEKMSVEDIMDKETPMIEKYADEFEKNGIQNLTFNG